MNKITFAVFSALLADYIMVTIIVPIINDLFRIDYGEIDEFRVGFVYSMKGLSQLCTGLLVGKISDKLQLKLMIQLGLLSDLTASLVYMFGRKFPSYMAARGFHGIGSSLISASSFSLLAYHFKTDKERGEIMSNAGIGIACGVLSGPVVGGILYSLGETMKLGSFARIIPFSFCSIADILAISAIHFFIKAPYRLEKKQNKSPSTSSELEVKKKTVSKQKNLSNWQILKFTPIFALVYISFIGNLECAYIEPILPNYWMKLTENNWSTFKSGVVFAFSPLSYTVFVPLFGKYGYKVGRHYIMFAGMIIIGSVFLIVLPSKELIYFSVIFLFMMGIGSGAIDSSLQPMLAQAYDNLLERKEREKALMKEVEFDISDNTLIERNDVKVVVEPTTKDISDNHLGEVIKVKEEQDIKEKDVEIEEQDINEKEVEKKSEEEEEEEEEEAHNKYTRVFSLGNMAMNIGFITGPMISSFIVSLIDGDEPNVNRFNSSFFKCCSIFTAIACISSFVALIPGMKRYQSKKNKN